MNDHVGARLDTPFITTRGSLESFFLYLCYCNPLAKLLGPCDSPSRSTAHSEVGAIWICQRITMTTSAINTSIQQPKFANRSTRGFRSAVLAAAAWLAAAGGAAARRRRAAASAATATSSTRRGAARRRGGRPPDAALPHQQRAALYDAFRRAAGRCGASPTTTRATRTTAPTSRRAG